MAVFPFPAPSLSVHPAQTHSRLTNTLITWTKGLTEQDQESYVLIAKHH